MSGSLNVVVCFFCYNLDCCYNSFDLTSSSIHQNAFPASLSDYFCYSSCTRHGTCGFMWILWHPWDVPRRGRRWNMHRVKKSAHSSSICCQRALSHSTWHDWVILGCRPRVSQVFLFIFYCLHVFLKAGCAWSMVSESHILCDTCGYTGMKLALRPVHRHCFIMTVRTWLFMRWYWVTSTLGASLIASSLGPPWLTLSPSCEILVSLGWDLLSATRRMPWGNAYLVRYALNHQATFASELLFYHSVINASVIVLGFSSPKWNSWNEDLFLALRLC